VGDSRDPVTVAPWRRRVPPRIAGGTAFASIERHAR
jgi:hypothetical protein